MFVGRCLGHLCGGGALQSLLELLNKYGEDLTPLLILKSEL